MSRMYDGSECYIPQEAINEGICWVDGIGYALIHPYRYYYITSEGDVISTYKENPRYVKEWHTNHGHLYVDLSENGVRERRLVHRLVAEAFVNNPNNYPIVRHLDDDPKNNYYKNLAWGTMADNHSDMVSNDHDYRKEVYCYETDTTYRTCREAARDLGVSFPAVTTCCKGIAHTCSGMHLCYKEDLNEKLNDPEWLKERSPYKPIIAISPEGEWIQFPSRKAAAEAIGIHDSCISNVMSGKIKQTHGWRFKEVNSNA